MILPIVAYGDPILRKNTHDVPEDYPDLEGLVDNMFETMYAAPGIGLAAPQVGLPIRMFVVDTEQIFKADDESEDGNGIEKEEDDTLEENEEEEIELVEDLDDDDTENESDELDGLLEDDSKIKMTKSPLKVADGDPIDIEADA